VTFRNGQTDRQTDRHPKILYNDSHIHTIPDTQSHALSGTGEGSALKCIHYSCRKKLSNKHSVAVSANAACGDTVNENPSGIKEDYENLGMILESVNNHSISDKETGTDLYETISPSYRQPGVEKSEYTSLSWKNCARGQQN
jgi:hypothetical protein